VYLSSSYENSVDAFRVTLSGIIDIAKFKRAVMYTTGVFFLFALLLLVVRAIKFVFYQQGIDINRIPRKRRT